MKYAFFTIPVHGGDQETQALNAFCAGHRVLEVNRQFVMDGQQSLWAFCVSYLGGDSAASPRRKVDYKDVLSEQEFAVYARLRELRSELARQEGVPAYAVFTNEQLATMVQERISTVTGLAGVSGVGEGRAAKYGPAFFSALAESLHNDTGESA